MNKPAVFKLLLTQFLSALADNAILMATIYVISQSFTKAEGDVYTGIVQASFFVAYILLAPYASVLSERVPKANVLWIGNVLKLAGAVFLWMGMNPAVSYAMVGIGACVYGPGKYAILRELTDNEKDLYKANGWVEGSTIMAILLGTVMGELLSKFNFTLSMSVIVGIYALSFFVAWLLPKGSTSAHVFFHTAWREFMKDVKTLCQNKEAFSSLIGTGSFWMISSVIRIAMIAWIPVVLHLGKDGNVSLFMGVTAIGIMLGAFLSARLIPLDKIQRLFVVGLSMSLSIMAIGFFSDSITISIVLFLSGFTGGLYLIPLNTVLQQRGDIVGSGKTIAIQNLFDNGLMVIGMVGYTGFLKLGVSIPVILIGFAVVFVFIALFVRQSFMKAKAS